MVFGLLIYVIYPPGSHFVLNGTYNKSNNSEATQFIYYQKFHRAVYNDLFHLCFHFAYAISLEILR